LGQEIGHQVKLPAHENTGGLPINAALQQRRSTREYRPGQLLLTDISQILWSAQGINHLHGLRTAPSAGALYPLEIYLVTGDIRDLPAGVYQYRPNEHELVLVQSGDQRKPLASAALNQTFIRHAPAVLVITGIYQRTTRKYGQRGRRYVHMEAGHAAQNVYLQTEARGLATVYVGAFEDAEVQRVLGLPQDHEPLGLMPIGHKR